MATCPDSQGSSSAVSGWPFGTGLSAGPDVHSWLVRRSSHANQWTADELLTAKGATSVSVVIPARDEQSTVGDIITKIRHDLMEQVPLVDEIVVVDSRSSDRTAEVAAASGARVVAQDDVLPWLPYLDGKGDALWKGLAASDGDLVVFIDADLSGFSADFVTGLLGPLLTDPTLAYVKGFYYRPFIHQAHTVPDGGGRVTELVARPLLNMCWPELAGFVQPLAGEYAGRRNILEQVPFVTGYGTELGLLIDLLELIGLDAMAQVDLGHRCHTHQDNEALGRMAGQIMLTAFARLQRQGRLVMDEPPSTVLAQFRRGDSECGIHRELVVTDIAVQERPPLAAQRVADELIGQEYSGDTGILT
ncbi:MAG: glucosyl-3-phosphoglycerate synthase [Actinomycetota bacterium]|nr:glucosyl-3-phosphoglycerate synthase [Actinomycetota bacterium]